MADINNEYIIEAIDNLIEIPILGFFLAWVGWLIPLAFFYGEVTGE